MIALLGATGYVGGRLLRLLEERGETVRCIARRPEFLLERVAPGTEVVYGDLTEPDSLRPALAGADTAYFLAHAMGAGAGFEEEERRGAQAFATAARGAGVSRIIYLGGLGHGDDLSPHLRSRQSVGRILRKSGVPTLEFRASIIIGSGSLSYEMVRSLVERLPVMVTPRWVSTLTQPIAIEDLLAYLVAALDAPLEESRVVEIGGPDRVSYGDLMREYAQQRGLTRTMIPVPLLSPRLSSLWLRLVTPMYATVGRKLVDGLRNETIVREPEEARTFAMRPMGVKAAMGRAMRNEDREFAETRWTDAFSMAELAAPHVGTSFGTRIVDSRTVRVSRPPAAAFAPIQRIGGKTGYYYGNLWWRVRGWLDLLMGGPGLRRGRRDPVALSIGATVDCWRVEAFEPDRMLRLAAEMKLPGRGWLQFEVKPDGDGATIRQTAVFDPRGLGGLAYWYGLYPIHQFVFNGMLRGIARAAEIGA